MVALSVLRHGSAHGLPDATVQLAARALLSAGPSWRWLAWLARSSPGRRLLDLVEWIALPGLARHHCRRKAWLLQALQQRPLPSRWLWVGIGLDGCGPALQRTLGSVELLAFDQPDTLGLRHRLLGKDGGRPLQLPEDAQSLLRCCAQAPSTLVLEGVCMYLPGRALLRLLSALAALPRPPRLLFSALDVVSADGRGFARAHPLTRRWLAAHGEPFLWRLPRDRTCALLQRCGYRIAALWDGEGYGEYMVDALHEREAGMALPSACATAPCPSGLQPMRAPRG